MLGDSYKYNVDVGNFYRLCGVRIHSCHEKSTFFISDEICFKGYSLKL